MMTTPMSRRFFLGLTAACVAWATACGVAAPTAEVEPSDGPVTLRFAWWGSDGRHQLTQQAIDAFAARHPNITVEGEFSDWTGYWDRVATTFAANDAPDIVQMDELYLRTYADRGALLDLGQLGEYLDTSQIPENRLATGRSEGTQYALPVGVASLTVVANVDLFRQYGIPLPDDQTWTWDDLAGLAQQITQASGGTVYGVPGFGYHPGLMTVVARQQGASLYDDQGQVALPTDLLARWWTYARGLLDSGAAPSAEVQSEFMGATLNQSALALGRSAMDIYHSTQISAFETLMPGTELALLELPRTGGSDVAGFYYKPSMYWSVSSGTEHPAEAAMFTDFLANDPEAARILGTERGIPANPALLDVIRPGLDAPALQAAEFNDRIADVVGTPPALTPPGASGVEQLGRRFFEDVLFDRQTPEQAAEGFVAELTSVVEAGR
jgi:multiple sugar transport system substrate-binding protein